MAGDVVAERSVDLVNPDPSVVTVWSDLGCPWATLALDTLRAAAVRRGHPLLVDHRAFPLELFNRIPTPKSILDAEIVTIAGHLPQLGWRLWAAHDSTYPVTMLPPMEAVQAAKDPSVGGLLASDQLDAALRHAFYVDSRCISIPSVIHDVAASCELVDEDALALLVARGAGRAEIYRQWAVAQGPQVQGSPQILFGPQASLHNPGATYRWTGRPWEGGLPRLEAYDPQWADALLDALTPQPAR